MTSKPVGYLILGLSLVGLVFSAIIFTAEAFQTLNIDVEGDAIFSGSSGVVQVEKNGVYSVYVASDIACEDVEVSIYTEDDGYLWEYFYKDCDQIFDEVGWTYVGYFSSDLDGSLNVDSTARVSILEDDVAGILAFFTSICLGCCGLVGLVIAIVILATAKEGATTGPQQVIYVDSRSRILNNEGPVPDNSQEWWEDVSDS